MSHDRHLLTQRILTAVFYLEARLAEPLTLELLADRAGMSPFYFHRQFRQIVGEPPMEYLRRLRLELAACGLIFGRQSLSDLALRCGYESREGLLRAFRREWGVTPTEFRRRMHEAQARRLARLVSPPEPAGVQIVELPPRHVAVVRCWGGLLSIYAAWWRLLRHLQRWPELPRPVSYLDMLYDDDLVTAPSRNRYDAAIEVPPGWDPPPPLVRTTIAGGQFAVLKFRGSARQLLARWDWFVHGWLTQSQWHIREFRGINLLSGKVPATWWQLLARTSKQFEATLCIPVQPYNASGLPEFRARDD